MGILNTVFGQALGALSQTAVGEQTGWVEAIGGLLNHPQVGGLSGLVAAFHQNGLGEQMASWVGTGDNLPVSAEQLQSVLGSELLQSLAQQMGLSSQEVSNGLSGVLPKVVDMLTPEGALPEGDLSAGLRNVLNGFRF